MPKIDAERIREIPIIRVCELLHMKIRRSGAGVWGMVDEDNPREMSSLSIFEKTNTFVRFSGKTVRGVSKGDVIALVMHMRDVDFKTAIHLLADSFPEYTS